MKLAFVALLFCCALLFSACGATPSPTGSIAANSASASVDDREKPSRPYAFKSVPFAENLSLAANEIVRVLDADTNFIYFAIDEKIRGDAYFSGSQSTKRIGKYQVETQAITIFQTFKTSSTCYRGIAFGDAFLYCVLEPTEAAHTVRYQIYFCKGDEISAIAQGVCTNSPPYTPDFAVYANQQVAYSYANIDASGNCTDFGISLVDSKKNVTELFSRKQSESSRFINSKLCSDGNKLLYFVEENQNELFYLFDAGVSTTFGLEKGKKMLDYCMVETGALFMLSANEDTDTWQRELSFLNFGSMRWNSYKSNDYYRMESNAEDLILAIDSSFDIYLLSNDNRQPIMLPEEVIAKDPHNVRFFNTGTNQFFLFFENSFELLQWSQAHYPVTTW